MHCQVVQVVHRAKALKQYGGLILSHERMFKLFTGPRPLNSSPTPPVYAWSVSQDLVDRTLSDQDEDGFFDGGEVMFVHLMVMMLVHLMIVLLIILT